MTATRVPIWFGAIFAFSGLVFVAIGWSMAGLQHYRLATYQPVPARVIESHVKTRHGDKGETYAPAITYQYAVGQAKYQSSRVLPMGSLSTSGDWAWRTCAQYPAGLQTTAWYCPVDPGSAYLIHQGHWFPHIFTLFPAIFIALGVGLIEVRLRTTRSPPAPAAQPNGWYKIAEEGTLRHRTKMWLLCAISIGGYFLLVLGDYFNVNGKQADLFLLIVGPICAAIAIAPLWMMWRSWRLQHDFLDASVFVNAARIAPGDAINVRIRQPLLRPLQIADLSVGIVCVRSDRTRSGSSVSYNSSEAWSAWKQVLAGRTFAATQPVEGQTALQLPPDAALSGSSAYSSYPFFEWRIAVRVQAQGQPQLDAKFPIRVEAAAHPAAVSTTSPASASV